MSRIQQLASDGLEIGSVTIPVWALWVFALVVVLIIVGVIVAGLARRARKIARASGDASDPGEDGRSHGFGFYGAVTSAISITPDVKPRSRGSDGSKSDE